MTRNTKNFVVAKKNNLKNSSKLYSISNVNSRRHKMDSGGKNHSPDDECAITSVNIKENIMRNRIVNNKKSNCLVLMSVQLILLLVLLNYFVDIVESQEVRRTRQHKAMMDRDPRKMFGGYRITPKFCTPSRPSRRYRTELYNQPRGPAICMFNHECLQRQGEVVGSCMDGFLFGACCQLFGTPGVIRDTVEEGVVMPQNDNLMNTDMTPDKLYNVKDEDISISVPQIIDSLMDISGVMKTTDKYEAATIKEGSSTMLSNNDMNVQVENHFVKHPSTLAASMNFVSSSTQKYHDLTSSGVAQITSTLLQSVPNDADIVNLGNLPDTGLFSLSTISHEEPDTYLIDSNGSVIADYAKPSDFSAPENGVQVSTMQTKPIMSTQKPTTASVATVKPNKPFYPRPGFRPKPTKVPVTQDKFVLVQTMTKPDNSENVTTSSAMLNPSSQSELASIQSIITMLDNSRPSSVTVNAQTNPINDDISTTAIPQSYSSGIPPVSSFEYVSTMNFPTGGHYVTTAVHSYSTQKPPSTNQVYKPIGTKRPSTTNHHISSSGFFTRKPVTQAPTYDISNSDSNDNVISSTLSYDEYWGSPSDSYTTPFPNRKPPSTSYVYGPTPTKRPVSSIHNIGPNYDVGGNLDTFSSVTPTVILLDSLSSQYESYTPKPTKFPAKPLASDSSDDNYVQIPLKPPTSSANVNNNNYNNNNGVNNKKPIHQVTINNIISSTNMIHLGAMNSGQQTVSSTERPSPTVLITPKPTTNIPPSSLLYTSQTEKPSNNFDLTTTYDFISTSAEANLNKAPSTVKPSSSSSYPPYYTVPNVRPSFSSYDQTTLKNEIITSPDELINFPPVRNPNLEVSGTNHNVFNNTISLSVDDAVLPEVEFTTPDLVPEDDDLNDKMSLFVNKIVGSFQGTFQELHDIVILDKSPPEPVTTKKPTRKTSTTKKPTRISTTASTTTTKKPPSKKPAKSTTRRPTTTTTTEPTTTEISTRKPTKASTTPKPKPKPTKPKTTLPPTTITTEEVVGEEEESYTTETPSGEFKHLCGVRPLVKSGRIVGGKGATFGEWPWQVLVRESTWLGLFTKNKCGGVLITNSYVTTAAHCQPGFLASLVAVMGEFDISGDLESKRSITKNVRRVIVHRNYDAATFENDLALLELESPVVFDAHIVPICMPADEADFTGRFATVTGWGRLKYGGGVPSVLQEVKVPVIENSVCQEMFHTAGHSKVILNSFLCAGYANGQKDSCEGDSGGPLVLQRPDGRWELAGTVSHGIKCAAPYLPGVYMRTTFYKPWLKSITGVH